MAKVREAPLDVQFRIYYFNQISDQNKEANFLGLNVKLDVASYADYQKTDKDAKLNHYLAVQEMKHLYKLIRDKDFKLEDLSAVTVRLYMHAQRAQEAYVKLASQFPKSKSIMRYFARFCYDVTKDQIRGDNLTYYADELENRRETDDRKKLQPMQPDTRIDTSASDVGRSDTGSSYVTRRAVHVAQRQREARMRSRRLQVNLLFIFKTVGILALWVANFYVVLNLLQISQSSLTRLTWQADRKIYIATSFLRIRQMEAAKNEAEYEVTRSKFQEEMRNLSYIFREIFLNREESDSLENAYDTQNMFTMYFSGYPTVPILIPINTSVFHYTEAVAASGTVVANLSWDTFKDRPSYNNDVRFVLDNYSGAQTIFSLPMQAFLHREWSKTSAAIKTVYILMGCQLFINIVLAIIVDLLFGRFHKGQQAILEVFRHIPRDVLKEELDSLEESDGSDFFPQSIVKFAEKMSRTESTQFSRKNFRIFLIVATVCLVALTAVTAYLNVGVFKSVAESFSVLDMGSTIKEYLARSVVLAQEFNGNDTITWSSKKVLADNYQTAFLTMFKAFEGIVFGDSDHEPPTQSYNHFAPSVVQLLNYEKCLPFNTSLCSPTGRVWNETLAYTYDIVSGGLFQLTHYFLKFHVGILTSASIGVPIDPTSVDTMLKFLEPDLLDGWTQFRIRMIDYVADVHEKSVNLNYVLFSFFLALLITSFAIELYVVRKLLDNYRFTEHGIYGILGSLPSHARRIHAIAALLKLTGEADAEMGAETLNNGPAGPTASPKTERSPSARRSTIKPGDITRSPSRRRVVLRTAEIPEITIDNHADSHPAAEKEGGSMEEKEGSLRAE